MSIPASVHLIHTVHMLDSDNIQVFIELSKKKKVKK